MFNGENVRLEPGQLITGRKDLASKTGIKESTIERILTFFEKSEQQIEQQKTNRNRLITILSWSDHQYNEQQNGQPADNQRTTDGQPADTYKKEKKDNNDKNNINIAFELFWNEYHRLTGKNKTDKDSSLKYWKGLIKAEQQKAIQMISAYAKTQEDPKYLKKARTYLSDKNFNDELEAPKQGLTEVEKMNLEEELLNRLKQEKNGSN